MDLRKCLTNKPIKIGSFILTLDEKIFHEIVSVWNGDNRNDSKTNKSMILGSINLIYSSKRYDEHLM